MIPNLIVIFIILYILYLAIKPMVKFKKQKGSCYSCYGCSQNIDGQCNIKKLDVKLILDDIKKAKSI